MDGVKAVQAKDPAALRRAVKDNVEFVLFDGDEPLFRCTPVPEALASKKNFFIYYPHEPAECLYTCWRHPREGAAVADVSPQPALAG